MALLAILNQEAYDALPESINPKEEYKKQDDGTFLADITPVNGHALENILGLKSSLSKTLDREKVGEKKLKEFEGLDPGKAREAMKKVEDMANWSSDDKVKEQIAAFKKQLSEKHLTEIGEKDAVAAILKTQLEKVLIDADAVRAIVEAGGEDGAATVLLPHVRMTSRMKQTESGGFITEIFDKEGVTRISPATNSTDPMTIPELVEEIKANKIFAPLFKGSGASGSGAQNTTTTTKGKANLVELGKLSPAERMKQAQEQGIHK